MAEKTTNYNLTKPSAEDFYDVGVQNANMDIVDAELKRLNDGKAPSGHGLGVAASSMQNTSLLEMMAKGCGFYQVQGASDTPASESSWINLLQTSRGTTDGKSTGFQIASYDFYKNNPKIWFRTMVLGETSAWNEMLHTGNYSKFANARITTGFYEGWVTDGSTPSEIVLSFDFAPKLIILKGISYESRPNLIIFMHGYSGFWAGAGINNTLGASELSTVWEGNTIKFGLNEYGSKSINWFGNIYNYVAIG